MTPVNYCPSRKTFFLKLTVFRDIYFYNAVKTWFTQKSFVTSFLALERSLLVPPPSKMCMVTYISIKQMPLNSVPENLHSIFYDIEQRIWILSDSDHHSITSFQNLLLRISKIRLSCLCLGYMNRQQARLSQKINKNILVCMNISTLWCKIEMSWKLENSYGDSNWTNWTSWWLLLV